MPFHYPLFSGRCKRSEGRHPYRIKYELCFSNRNSLSLSLSGLVNLMGSFFFFFAGFPAFPTVMDINQIREILPHR
jgi:hypothetical protein